MQEQINRLGEEVAIDINELEKRLNSLQSQVQVQLTRIVKGDATLQPEAVNHNVEHKIASLEERKASIEEVKIVQSRQNKIIKDLNAVKGYGEKTRERVRALERSMAQMLLNQDAGDNPYRGRSRSQSSAGKSRS